jgi:hypothetical protein
VQRTQTQGGSGTEVPWYEFHEFEELSSRTFRSLEEQLYIKKAQLKRQPTQHAAVLIPGHNVEMIKASTIKEHPTTDSAREEFKQACFEQSGWYKSPGQADHELNEIEQKLLGEDRPVIEVSRRSSAGEPKPKRRASARKSIFATIKESPDPADS